MGGGFTCKMAEMLDAVQVSLLKRFQQTECDIFIGMFGPMLTYHSESKLLTFKLF